MQQSVDLVKQGYLSLQQNNPTRAAELFNQAKELDPSCFDAWLALGNLFSQMNNLMQAEYMLKKAVTISPDNPAAHGQLGVVLYRSQRLDEAINCYQKVVKLQPGNPAAHANLAMVYIDIGKREAAVNCCQEAIKLRPDFTGAYILLASAYLAQGLFELALDSYNDALGLEVNNLSALAGKANTLIKLGRKKEAYETIRQKLDINHVDPSIAIAYASVSTVVGSEQEAAVYLENGLRIPSLTPMQQLQLHFSAGKLYDHMGQYDKAFQHYTSGNGLAQRSFDANADRKIFEDIIEVFSCENIRQFPRVHPDDLVPVFIVGMPRSGTSLVESILAAHAEIYPAGELAEIPKLSELVSGLSNSDKIFPKNMQGIDEDILKQLSRQHIEYLRKISGGINVVTDKLPHNFLFLGLIELLFPNAKVIHCKRNPLDTCLSNYFQYFSGPLAYPYKLKDIASHYNNYQHIMAHWEATLNLPILEVRYENLVCEQKAITEELLAFLDLPMDKSCLEFYQSGHVTRTASFEQVRSPIYKHSVGRWKNYEKHIDDLINNIINV